MSKRIDRTDDKARVLEWVRNGWSLSKCARELGLTRAALCHWQADDAQFKSDVREATLMGAEVDADRLQEITDKVEAGELTPEQARVMTSTIQWMLSKRLRNVYGDTVKVEQAGVVEVKVSYADAPSTEN